MNRQIAKEVLLMTFLTLLLVSCTVERGEVALPRECDSFSFSPGLDWVTYMCGDVLWLAPLPTLQDAVPVVQQGDDSLLWAREAIWMPNETGFLLTSYKRTEATEQWWLVRLNNFDTRIPLITLPIGQRIPIWSPIGTAIAAINRGGWGGSVTLVHTDGSASEELPIAGLVGLSPSISWSPDGSKIAYAYVPYPEGLDASEVRTIDVGTHQTTTVYPDGGLPEWFPDGKMIALFGWDEVIPVIRANGSGVVREIKIPDGYDVVRSRGNVWSPDGSRLALYLEIEGLDYEPVAVGVLDQDRPGLSVFEAPYFSEIVGWTPDGNAVVTLAHEAVGDVLREVPVVR